jgi:hypothetical protein
MSSYFISDTTEGIPIKFRINSAESSGIYLLLDCSLWVNCSVQTYTPKACMSTPFSGCEVKIVTDVSQMRQLFVKLLAETR